MITKRSLTKAAEKSDRAVKAWNAAHPVGTNVILTDDFGEKHRTRTRSEAWAVFGSALVSVEGRSGGYLLDRIMAVDPKESPDA